jgi:hypothetical protein
LEEESKILINWFSINKMKANPENVQAIAVGKNTHDKNLKFNLEGIEIECETEVKLLGVTIDFKLNFNEHISNICKKASMQLNVLKRIGKHHTKLGKLTMYYSFIMSNCNHCPLVWHLCGEVNTNQRLSRACIVHLVIKRTNWSYVKTMACSGSHLGITINIKNTQFVKDLPIIDAVWVQSVQ